MKIEGADKPLIQYFTKARGGELKERTGDKVDFGNFKGDNFVADLIHMKQMAANSVTKAFIMPGNASAGVVARNETPVVIVHGTGFGEESISAYKDAALETGHPAELTTYTTIKEGEPMEQSGQLVSRNINNARMEISRKHLEELSSCKDDPEELKEYFGMSSDFYGRHDERVDRVVSLMPALIDKMEDLLENDKDELLKTFSGRTKEIEKSLAEHVRKAGYSDKKVAARVAGEIMDVIAPKAVIVGHSMGGFVSYTLALNPKAGDKSDFTYDGANGVSTVITLSSPVGKGVNKTLPGGLANYAYTLLEKNVLDPMETFPGMQFSMVNPFFNMWYSYNKELTKEMYKNSALIGSVYMNPIIHLMKPGYEQITEGSDFIKKYVDNKKVPDGVTVIAISNRHDGVSEQDRSMVDEKQPNAHNLDAEITIKPEELKNPKSTVPTLAHMKMALYPFEHGEEFRKEVMEDPKHITRILDPANYDGVRWKCLSVLKEDLEKDPAMFRKAEFKPVLEKIRSVASEEMPFADSPSYIARQILDKLG